MKKFLIFCIFAFITLISCFSFPQKPPKEYYNRTELIEMSDSYRIVINKLKNISDYELVQIFFVNRDRLTASDLVNADIALKNEDGIIFFEISKKYFQDDNIIAFYLYNLRKGKTECYIVD